MDEKKVNTTMILFRYWKDWKRFGKDLQCILDQLMYVDFII